MPLTNAQLQKRHRDRIKEKLARLERYEGALKEIAGLQTKSWSKAVSLATEALADR